MSALKCCICHLDASMMNTCDKDKPESYEEYVCGHRACKTCLKHYIVEHLDNERHVIKCPDVSCDGLISYYDIDRIDTSLASMYRTTLKALSIERNAPSLWEGCVVWEAEKPARCPTCFTYVYRWDGCEIIYCICGSAFCSDCCKLYVKCSC